MKTWSAQNPLASGPADSSARSDGRASWYAQGVSDAVGDRLLMFDNSGGPSLELLRFSWKLMAVPGFENALRERVELLSQFRHPSFAKVRAVERLEPKNDLTLVSNHVPGKRLSDELAALRGPAFALWLLREIVPALAGLHQHSQGVAHGALTADRIMMTPEGRLVILEHVLGPALEQLQLSHAELWARFGIPTPPAEDPVRRLDPAGDVFQLGVVALSVLLGRHVATFEFPGSLHELLGEFQRTSGRELPTPLRMWLLRALRLEGKPFEDARDAQSGLGELEAAPSVAALPGVAAEQLAQVARAIEPVPERESPPPSVIVLGGQSSRAGRIRHLDATAPLPANPAPSRPVVAADLLKEHRPELSKDSEGTDTGWRGWALAAVAVIAVAQTGYIGYLLYSQPPAVVIQPPPTATNAAPKTTDAGSVAWQAMNAQTPVSPAQAPAADLLNSPAAAVKAGGVRLISRIEMQLLDGERVLGSTADGHPIVTSAGRHEFELVNSALGYHAKQVFNIKPGEILSVAVPQPQGKMSINAVPWADVWIDGAHIGETPLANLSVPIGQHEVSFRHPSFAEQRKTTVVRYDVPTRLSADLR